MEIVLKKRPERQYMAPAPPKWLAHLHQEIFSELPEFELKHFNESFLPILLAGPDVRHVRTKLAVLRLKIVMKRLMRHDGPMAQRCRAVIQSVIGWHLDGELMELEKVMITDIREALALMTDPALKLALRCAAASVASFDQDSPAETAAAAMWAAASAMWVSMDREGVPPGSLAGEEVALEAIRVHYRWEAANLLKLLVDTRCLIEGGE